MQQTLEQRQQTDVQAKAQPHTSSSRTPEQCDISDDDLDAEEPTSVPQYDLTDDRFKVLQGKINNDDIDRLRKHYNKTIRLARR